MCDKIVGQWSLRFRWSSRRKVVELHPLYVGGEMVGRATSGNYGFRLGKSLALAMLRPQLAVAGTALEIEVLGERRRAQVVGDSPWDPANDRLRA